MAGMCCGVVGETETPAKPGLRRVRRRRMEIHPFKLPAADMAVKRQKVEEVAGALECENAVENSVTSVGLLTENGGLGERKPILPVEAVEVVPVRPKFGMTSVRGRRRDMEDAVAIHPSFCRNGRKSGDLSFYGLYDGHGCSHVAMKCGRRLHEIVREKVEGSEEASWKETMERSFSRMDEEATDWCSDDGGARASGSDCRCELRTPHCDAVGSTAVVAVVTPHEIVVSNCGDSRAVLWRNGIAIPLSSDQKPDRPDELERIEKAGGRVIYWDGARVLGVLAMSRAIGDSYLKPFVIPEPEVTVTDRTAEDECLILASDGLWDVVSNETACGVARMCLQSQKPASPPQSPGSEANVDAGGESSDKACLDASILLTKLALARNSTDNISVVVVDLRKGQ